MTIALVGETQARRGAAGVLDHLAELAVSDEMVVVFGSDDHPSGSGVQPVVAGLRHLLPRHTVVVLYAGPHDRPLWREATLLDELLEFGVLPVVVTPVAAVPDVAAELAHHLRADRILRVAGDRPVSGPGPTCVRSAA
jgi:hypothetical protein